MAGNQAGGLKAAATNKARHGDDHYIQIGKIGGSRCVPKGFAVNRELASRAGRIGGLKSRRGKTAKKITVQHQDESGMEQLVEDPIRTTERRRWSWRPF